MLDYQTFLQSKKTIAQTSGIEVSLDAIHPMLFPFQKELVRWALRKGRAALFADTGLGKSLMQVEYARLTEKRALIVAPLSVARQTVNEAKKIDVEVYYTRSGDDIIDGINITNYEMIDKFNFDDFGCIILDESSILKSMTGKIRTKLIEKAKNVPYRLCCTATPAPNDITEIANHAEVLGVTTRGKMLSMFFIHDGMNTARDGWRLKGHAHAAFYKWLASWSMSVKKPSDLGSRFSDEGYNLPPLEVNPVIVRSDYVPEGQLFFAGLHGITDRTKARKGTIEERAEEAVKLVSGNDHQWIIWCGLNDESSTLVRAIPGSVEIVGSDSPDKKIKAIEAFQSGDIRILVTKASIMGYGINLQNCSHMAFVGLGDSFELYYQAIRRCYRFGQFKPVYAYVILSEVEEEIYQNVKRKERESQDMSNELIKHVQQFERDEIENVQREIFYDEKTIRNDNYTLMLGDSCQRLKEVESNSVDLMVTSPPFAHLFTYTNLPQDLSNSTSQDEFYQHFHYIIDEMLRVLKPGRNACIHVAQLPATKTHDGFIGMIDFRGQIIQAFNERGWQYFGDISIDKNAQIQATRSKRKNLLFVQLNKDSSWMSPCFADYLIIFKKPGENQVPVKTDVTEQEWISWARPIWKGVMDDNELEFPEDWHSPVWYNIRETDVLNAVEAREKKDEKHVCPLQLELIERCIRLWSNPNEVVLDPFNGIGSTGYVAMQQRRQYIGCELKPSYFKTAEKNLRNALEKRAQVSLWDFAEAM